MVARRAIAEVLSLLLAAGVPLWGPRFVEVADNGDAYLYEVRVAVAKTPQKAAEALEADGWAVLRDENGPADLNQGADAALKSTRAVVLGYKTTDDPAQGLTDLAVMNMNGGYSFSDYCQLMDKYRDSQIRPFIERFMSTVAEYRVNAESDNPGNRARADMARTFLNRIVDDDTGEHLGELLLKETRAELGDAYEELPEDEQWTHIDLEVALMQGDASTVAQAERLLSLAADSNETTWLERLSALGPDGLMDVGMRPADARAELAANYQDLAVQLAEGWEDMRAVLLAQKEELGQSVQQTLAEDVAEIDAAEIDGAEANDAMELEVIDNIVELGTDDVMPDEQYADPIAEDTEPLVIEGEIEAPVVSAPASAPDVVVLGEDEMDLAELVSVEPPDIAEEVEIDDIEPEDVPLILEETSDAMGSMADSGQDLIDARNMAIAGYLVSMPYGDGTLYDLFTRPASEVTGDNIAELYPAASCLSEGQAAAIEFLSLPDLLQVGATTGDALSEIWTDYTGLKENSEAAPEVSLYEGVDREVFGKLTALTSEAMRADALRAQDTGVQDFLSIYRRSTLLWTCTAITAIVAGASAYHTAINKAMAASQVADAVGSKMQTARHSFETIKNEVTRGGAYKNTIISISQTATSGSRKWQVSIRPMHERYRELQELQREVLYNYRNKTEEYNKLAAEIREWSQGKTKTMWFGDEYTLKQGMEEFSGNFDDYIKKVEVPTINTNVSREAKLWGAVGTVAGVAFFVLTLASIISTVADVVAYYNVEYAPIPGYIVDVSDITQVAEDGTTTVVRNDRAYYRAATTNIKRDGKDLEAMGNYADLNGDGGKEWLALYTASRDGQAPILADSLLVVTGSGSVPSGYATGIHHFDEDAAANLTDARFSYNDDAGGVYVYFQRDEGMASVVGSVFGGGSTSLVDGVFLVVGVAVGFGVTCAASKRRISGLVKGALLSSYSNLD